MTSKQCEYLAVHVFDYPSNEEIINAIKRGITWNWSLAGHVARMLYNTNRIDVMEPSIELISSYEHVFKGDIFKPDISYEALYLM